MLALVAAAPTGECQHLDASHVAELRWRAIGPAAIGGRIVDIDVDRSKTTTIFAASATGGLWRSRNNGTTWDCIFENEGTISIGDIAVDPNDANVIWVGTGEANNQRSAYWGDGVYKTTDGGETWINTGLSDSHHIGRVVIDPRNRDVVYVAAMGHQYTTNEQRGVYKTTDGGRTWKRKLYLGDAVGVIDLVIDPSRPDRLFAASYERLRRPWNYDGKGEGSGIHRSDDGGETWTRLEGGLPGGELGRIGVDLCASKPDVVYATVSNQNPRPPEESSDTRPRFGVRGSTADGAVRVTRVLEGEPASKAGVEVDDLIVAVGDEEITKLSDLLRATRDVKFGDAVVVTVRRGDEELKLDVTFEKRDPERSESGGTIGGEIYRSDDGGDTWTRQNDDPVGGSPPYYYGQIRVDPNDADRIFVLSVPVYRSDDGGKTFAEGNQARSVHVDHHALWIDPQNPDRLLLGNDGGLAFSYDGGATWDHVNNLPIAQFYTVAVDMAEPYFIYGGTQDNGSWRGPSSTSGREVSHIHWTRVGGGDGFYVQVDPEHSRTAFVESQFGALQRLDLQTWDRSSIQPRPEEGSEERYRFNWSSPILMSSHNSGIVYFGGNRLFKSLNGGERWQVISEDLSTADEVKLEGDVPHCTITTIAESSFDPDRILVGTDDGNVQWSDDGGHSYHNLVGRFPGLPSHRWVSRVEFSPHDRDTAYAAFTGYREDDFAPYVYRTRDAGEMWESIAGNLPPGPINVVREDPRRPDLLYVGTEFGVFVSADGGARWVELGNDLPTVPVHDLVVHPRDRELVIGTHGRGFFVLDAAPLQGMSAEALGGPGFLFDVKDVVQWRRQGEPSTGASGDRFWTARNPDPGATLWWFAANPQEEGTIQLDVLDPKGEVVRALSPSREAGVHSITWDLRRDAQETEGRRRRGGGVDVGTYTARLRIGETTWTRDFEVRSDPNR